MKNTIENAPALEIDKILYKTTPMLPRTRRERRVVWNLFNHLLKNGKWRVARVWDGEESHPVNNSKEAMEIIFNLDDAWIGFKQPHNPRTHYVRLVLGNDLDIIADWRYSEDDPDGFDAAMEKFDAEVYA